MNINLMFSSTTGFNHSQNQIVFFCAEAHPFQNFYKNSSVVHSLGILLKQFHRQTDTLRQKCGLVSYIFAQHLHEHFLTEPRAELQTSADLNDSHQLILQHKPKSVLTAAFEVNEIQQLSNKYKSKEQCKAQRKYNHIQSYTQVTVIKVNCIS